MKGNVGYCALLIFKYNCFGECIEFPASETHRVLEGSQKVTREFQEGIPEGVFELVCCLSPQWSCGALRLPEARICNIAV